jgi:hypothetical protein
MRQLHQVRPSSFGSASCGRRGQRFSWCVWLVLSCWTATTTTATTLDNDHSDRPQNPVLVDDYLANLSDDDLRQICEKRGFEIAAASGGVTTEPTRQELLDGARRCLSLEDEMNAILAEHPDLAAELDKEIERMQRQKELLEQEREEMLALKAMLEQQLTDSGVDVTAVASSSSTSTHPSIEAKPMDDIVSTTTATTATSSKETDSSVVVAVPDTLEGVLRQSFVELYERVMLDVRMVRKLLNPVIVQLDHIWQFVWRYSKPLLGGAWDKLRHQVNEWRRPKTSKSSLAELPDQSNDTRRIV